MNSLRLLLVGLLLPGAIRAADPTPAERNALKKMLPELHLLEPSWASPIVHRESSAVLQKDDKSPIIARLGFPAAELISVRLATGEKTFEAGKKKSSEKIDLVVMRKGKKVEVKGVVLPEAGAPVIQEREMFPPEGSPMSYRHRVGNMKQNMLYGPLGWFHRRQIEVTYKPAPRSDSLPLVALAEKQLPKTLARLRKGDPVLIGVSGDSISTGLDSSAISKVAPHMPGYPDLVAAQLGQSYKSEITLKNRAISGWSISSGVVDSEKLLRWKPNLVIIAYGMNDVGRRDPKWYRDQTQKLIDHVREHDKDTEIILVSTMVGHGEWIHTPREMFPKYREALASLTGPGIALADVTAVWETFLKNKHDLDLTGNGLNHPNDFGHRLYAQTILSLLVPKP